MRCQLFMSTGFRLGTAALDGISLQKARVCFVLFVFTRPRESRRLVTLYLHSLTRARESRRLVTLYLHN